MPPYKPIEERFAEKYTIDQKTGCWPWHATKVTGGYGLIVLPRGSGHILAHRLSYQINIGEIPTGAFVCHRCDNPSCVNPAHLFLADHSSNMADMERKGRARILSAEDVFEALDMYRFGFTQQMIADRFGVHRSTVQRAFAKNDPGPEVTRTERTGKYTKLSAVQRVMIADLINAGQPIAVIARQFSVDRKTVRNLRAKIGQIPTGPTP